MKAFVYECRIRHQRLRPRQRFFEYGAFMLSLDLEAKPRVPFLSFNRFNLLSLDDRDHIDLDKSRGIRHNLIAWLKSKNVPCPEDAKVRIVTFPRVLGYAFNPVSFYYVGTSDGEPLYSVAEVRNTYHEMKLFLVDEKTPTGWQRKMAKDFYVSPFSEVSDCFEFKLGSPDQSWTVQIANSDSEGTTLVSSVHGERHPLTGGRLAWFFVKYPLLSVKVIISIHWQAFKLWFKKVPYFAKTHKPDSQRDVLRPHHSLTSTHE